MEFYVSLHTADPEETLEHEASYPGYSRVKLSRGVEWLSDEAIEIVFPRHHSPVTLTVGTHICISDENNRLIVVFRLEPTAVYCGICQTPVYIYPNDFSEERCDSEIEGYKEYERATIPLIHNTADSALTNIYVALHRAESRETDSDERDIMTAIRNVSRES